MSLREERIATMLAMGAKIMVLTEEEADAIDGEPGSEWIGTEGRAWLVDSLAEQDTKHWKQTLRELQYSVKRHPRSIVDLLRETPPLDLDEAMEKAKHDTRTLPQMLQDLINDMPKD
jgi:hypothetical protein